MWNKLSYLVRKSGRKTLSLLSELTRSGYSVADIQSLLKEIAQSKIKPKDIRLWTKHKTGGHSKTVDPGSERSTVALGEAPNTRVEDIPNSGGSATSAMAPILETNIEGTTVSNPAASMGSQNIYDVRPTGFDFQSRLRVVPVHELSTLFPRCEIAPPERSGTSYAKWQMELDDAPIFRWLYRAHFPKRHLEFGTWQGFGTCLCLEACDATVWTLNLPEGESRPDGTWAYGHRMNQQEQCPQGAVIASFGTDASGAATYIRTDAGGSIGRLYREKGLGARVCQVYCDSRDWIAAPYPSDFFDSVLIDGGHDAEIVVSDTQKALSVLRPGGLILWHDFCLDDSIAATNAAVAGVRNGIWKLLPDLEMQLSSLFWIEPSFILIGIKR